jgi:hypothetical protein
VPRRLITPSWYRRHKNTIGYLLLAAGVAFALAGVYATNKANQQRITHQACVTGKETRQPLLDYLESALKLNDTARKAHLLPPAPPALRRLQTQSIQNLRHLTDVFEEKQAAPCPEAP